MIPAAAFAGEYHGHTIAHLDALRASFGERPIIYLCGDSTLDNKHWLAREAPLPAANGYEALLAPPRVRPDVAAALNAALTAVRSPLVALNCAVEESTLAGRAAAPRAADAFVRAHARARDVIVVSAGGNDVVLAPALCTLAALAALLGCASARALERGDAPGFATLRALFKEEVEAYAAFLCGGPRGGPGTVIFCFPYFPEEKGAATEPSWADGALWALGYDARPAALQRVMRAVFVRATRAAAAPARTLALALFDVLDARAGAGDYAARVEPSAAGGAKIARALLAALADAGDARCRPW